VQIVHGIGFLVRLALSTALPFLVSPPAMALAGEQQCRYSQMYGALKWETDFFLNWNNKMRALWAQGGCIFHSDEGHLR